MLALDAAGWYTEEVNRAIAPMMLLGAMVQHDPHYTAVQDIFGSMASALQGQAPPNTSVSLSLLPNGVVRVSYPTSAAIGHDIFADPEDQVSARKACRDKTATLSGPLKFGTTGANGLAVRTPIFVSDVDEDETFGLPDPLNPYCGGPCAYNATTRTKFWGFASTRIALDALVLSKDSHLSMIEERGFRYQLVVAEPESGSRTVLARTSQPLRPGSTLEARISLPNAEWVLYVSSASSWRPDWFGGAVAAMVVVSVALSVLLFALLVSRRRHQILLEALLPKEMIQGLQKEDATLLGAPHIMQADTPADLLLRMMSALLEGRAPDLRNVVFIRSALLRGMDVYTPLNLRGHIKGAGLDAEVARSLMRQLGGGPDRTSRASFAKDADPWAGREGGSRDGTHHPVGSADGSPHAQPHARQFDTLAGALAMLLKPHTPGWDAGFEPVDSAAYSGAPDLMVYGSGASVGANTCPRPPSILGPLDRNSLRYGVASPIRAREPGRALPELASSSPMQPRPRDSLPLSLLGERSGGGIASIAAAALMAADACASPFESAGTSPGRAAAFTERRTTASGGLDQAAVAAALASTGAEAGSGAGDQAASSPMRAGRWPLRNNLSRGRSLGQRSSDVVLPAARWRSVEMPVAEAAAILHEPSVRGRLSEPHHLPPRPSVSSQLPEIRMQLPGRGLERPRSSFLGSSTEGELAVVAADATGGGGGSGASREVMRRNSSAPPPVPLIEEVERLLAGSDAWQYDTWRLAEASGGHALSTLGFYLISRAGLVSRLKLQPLTLARALRAIEAGYPANPYHSAVHAADVLQTLHVLLHGARLTAHYVNDVGLLAAYMAAIVHDYGHPGLTNDFLIATSHPLALRYNDRSPLESHHAAASFTLLARPELDITGPLSKAERAAYRKQVIEMVLATDMKQHFSILSHFNTVHRLAAYAAAQQQQYQGGAAGDSVAGKTPGGLPRSSGAQEPGVGIALDNESGPSALAPKPLDDTERLLSLQLALKVADIGHLGEGLAVHRRWLAGLEEEFFAQGDRERQLGLPISPLFDRAKQGVSKSQVGFYDFVGLPLAHAMAAAFPGAQPLMRCFVSNYDHWKATEAQAAADKAASRPAARQMASAHKPLAVGAPQAAAAFPPIRTTPSSHVLDVEAAPAAPGPASKGHSPTKQASFKALWHSRTTDSGRTSSGKCEGLGSHVKPAEEPPA